MALESNYLHVSSHKAPAVSEGPQIFAWENRSIRFLGLAPLVDPSHNLISVTFEEASLLFLTVWE